MPPYLPASFFLTTVTGAAGTAIAWAQLLAGSPSRFEHAGIVLDTDGTVLEAEPGGARIANLSEYAGRPLLVSDAPVQQCVAADHQRCINAPYCQNIVRARVVGAAKSLIGTPYSALDYAALAALHLRLPSGWIRRRVESSGHLICSALVDRVYANAGIHLFDDGRLSGDVMPADLAAYAEDHAS